MKIQKRIISVFTIFIIVISSFNVSFADVYDEFKENSSTATDFAVSDSAIKIESDTIELAAIATNDKIEKAIAWAEAIANDNSHGYNQQYRDGNPDYDCSSFVCYAFKNAGFNIPVGIGITGNTTTMRNTFEKEGFEWIEKSKVNSFQRGDILLNENPGNSGHTEIYLGNNIMIGARGGNKDGVFGDSLNIEICKTNYETYGWRSWHGILRYKDTAFAPTVITNEAKVSGTTLKLSGTVTANKGFKITDYGFYHGISKDQLYPNSASKNGPVITNTPFTFDVKNLTPGITYYYQAYATNEKGTSRGDILSITIPKPKDTTKPVISNFKCFLNDADDGKGGKGVYDWETSVGYSSLTFTATATDESGISSISMYMINKATGAKLPMNTISNRENFSYTQNDPQAGEYEVWVKAKDKSGLVSEEKQTLKVYGLTKKLAPKIDPAADSIDISWNCTPKPSYYNVYIKEVGDIGNAVGKKVTSSSYTATRLKPNTEYVVHIVTEEGYPIFRNVLSGEKKLYGTEKPITIKTQAVLKPMLKKPEITYPAENSTINKNDLQSKNITWEKSPNASSYLISLRNLDTEESIIYNKNIGNTNSYSLNFVLDKMKTGNQYRVAVCALADGYYDRWCEKIFTIKKDSASESIYIDYPMDGGEITYTKYGVFIGSSGISNLVIPSSINGVTITSIQNLAFHDDNELISVSIPDTVTEIGYGAFIQCENLQSVHMSKNITELSEDLFFNCHSLETVTGIENVQKINDCAFQNCWSFYNFEIPSRKLSYIGERAFDEVTLADFTVPEGLCIADGAFKGSYIDNIYINHNNFSFENNAFENSGAILHCYKNSNAHKYAAENNVKYMLYDNDMQITYPSNNEEIDKNDLKNKGTEWSYDGCVDEFIFEILNEDKTQTVVSYGSNTYVTPNRTSTGWNWSLSDKYLESLKEGETYILRITCEEVDQESKLIKEVKFKIKGEERFYTVTFNTQGGNSFESIKVKEGESIGIIPDPIKEGYIFNGWNFGPSEEDRFWDSFDYIYSNLDVYAMWIEDNLQEDIYYTVAFDTQGGNYIEPVKIKAGEELKILKTPYRDGYKFDGWSMEPGDSLVYPMLGVEVIITSNITIYAHWIKDNSQSGNDYINLSYGDIDDNKGITANDAACLLQKVLNNSFNMSIEEKTDDYMKYADVSGDGRLTAVDAAMILQKVLHEDFVFPIEVKE